LVKSRGAVRALLALFYATAGLFHLFLPEPFVGITPLWVPAPDTVVALTGVAELAGAAGLVQWQSMPLRRAAGWSLALYALCVWPANFNHMMQDYAKPDGGLGLGYHLARLAAQPFLIWLTLWSIGPTAIGDGGLRD
jgi:uncharacterized membrane protein